MRSIAFTVVAYALSILVLDLSALAQGGNSQLRLSESEARGFAEQAAEKSGVNERKFEQAFRDLVRTRIPKYEGKPVDLHVFLGSGINATVFGSLTAFQRRAWHQVRMYKPLSDAQWLETPIIQVTPLEMRAARIERAIVKRPDGIHEALENHIEDTDVQNLAGATFRARAGYLTFAPSVFEPFPPKSKGKFSIVLIPETGKNIEIFLYAVDLEKIFRD